jgi:hypothetical protein
VFIGVRYEDAFLALSGLDNEAVGSIEAIHVLDKNQLLLGSATGLHQVRIVEADSHGLARRVIIDHEICRHKRAGHRRGSGWQPLDRDGD